MLLEATDNLACKEGREQLNIKAAENINRRQDAKDRNKNVAMETKP